MGPPTHPMGPPLHPMGPPQHPMGPPPHPMGPPQHPVGPPPHSVGPPPHPMNHPPHPVAPAAPVYPHLPPPGQVSTPNVAPPVHEVSSETKEPDTIATNDDMQIDNSPELHPDSPSEEGDAK